MMFRLRHPGRLHDLAALHAHMLLTLPVVLLIGMKASYVQAHASYAMAYSIPLAECVLQSVLQCLTGL